MKNPTLVIDTPADHPRFFGLINGCWQELKRDPGLFFLGHITRWHSGLCKCVVDYSYQGDGDFKFERWENKPGCHDTFESLVAFHRRTYRGY